MFFSTLTLLFTTISFTHILYLNQSFLKKRKKKKKERGRDREGSNERKHKMCAPLLPRPIRLPWPPTSVFAFRAGAGTALHDDVNWSESLGMIKDFVNIKIISFHHKRRPGNLQIIYFTPSLW